MRKKEQNIITRRLVRSYMLSIISISLVLLLVGVVAVVAINAKQVSNYFKENVKISVILKENVSNEDAKELEKQLKSDKAVKNTTYISKEQGAEEMKQMLGEEFLSVFESNPLPISIELSLSADYFLPDSVSVLKNRILDYKEVSEVTYQASLIKVLNENIEKIGYVIIGFIILLLLVSFVLINNTVRLNIFSERFTTYTMKLVGATKGFIRAPFMYKAMLQGFISGVIASLILVGTMHFLREDIEQIFPVFTLEMLSILMGAIILLGVLICTICTFFVVNSLVSLTNDELYY